MLAVGLGLGTHLDVEPSSRAQGAQQSRRLTRFQRQVRDPLLTAFKSIVRDDFDARAIAVPFEIADHDGGLADCKFEEVGASATARSWDAKVCSAGYS